MENEIFDYIRNNDFYSFKKIIESDEFDLEIKTNMGNTVLGLSTLYDRNVFTRLLLTKNVNVNIQNEKQDTPLHYAILNDMDFDIIEQLLKMGTDPHIKNTKGESPIDLFKNKEQKENFLNLIRLTKLKEIFKK